MREDNKLSPAQEASVPTNLEDKLARLKGGQLAQMLEYWANIYHAFERSCQYERAQAAESLKWSADLSKANMLDQDAFPADSSERAKVRADVSSISEALSKRVGLVPLMRSEIIGERLKAHVELYQAMADLLSRHQVRPTFLRCTSFDRANPRLDNVKQKHAPDAVDKLRRKISTSQTKIDKYRAEQKPQSWEASARKVGLVNLSVTWLLLTIGCPH